MRPAIVFVVLQTDALANGGLQSITEVMNRLKAHRPIVLTNVESRISRAWRHAGIDVHIVPEGASSGLRRRPAETVRSYWRYYRSLREIIAASGARIVHANDPLAFQLSMTASKRMRARMTLSLRDTLDPARRPPRFKFRMIFAAADHMFYLSRDMAERWRQVAPNAMRSCSITYSIVDPLTFAPSAVRDRKKKAVLVTGIFSPKKGQLEFIRNVVPTLAECDIETWFAGDFEPASNPYAAKCAAEANPWSAHVRFLGYRPDLPELMRHASVVAVPSRHEGLMRGMIEAMACGRPVVSFDVCSAHEMLEEDSGGAGVVVAVDDYAGMARALIHYAVDREAQEEAGKSGLARARALFNPDAVVSRYERVYRELGER